MANGRARALGDTTGFVKFLADAGYELQEVEVLDIFPETHHVEVISLFTGDFDDEDD